MKLRRRDALHVVAGAAALAVIPRNGRAETYPIRPVSLVVWVPAGGGMPEPVVYEVELVDVVPKAAPSYSALH